MWWARRKRLRENGIVGINERNIALISRYNERANFPLVDNKLLTKRAAQAGNIAVPELLGVIDTPCFHAVVCVAPTTLASGIHMAKSM